MARNQLGIITKVACFLRACLKNALWPCEPLQHEPNRCDIDHGFPCVSVAFVIATKSAVLPQPSEGTLDDPTAWQDLERVQLVTLDDFHGAAPKGLGPLQQSPRIAPVRQDMSHAAAWRLAEPGGQQLPGPVAILNVGRQHRHQRQQTNRIDKDMPFAAP